MVQAKSFSHPNIIRLCELIITEFNIKGNIGIHSEKQKNNDNRQKMRKM